MEPHGWGIDAKELNPRVCPQDDFFGYVNSIWIKNNPIPDDESRWGAFLELRLKTDKQIKDLLEEVSRTKRVRRGSEDQLIRDFYLSGMDRRRRNKLGTLPIEPLREAIKKIKSSEDVIDIFALFTKKGITMPIDVDVDQDLKNSTRNVFYIGQDGLGMAEREHYLNKDAETLRVRNAYRRHVEKMFMLLGYTPRIAKRRMEVILRIETALAKASMNKVERRDPYKIYHKKTKKELAALAPTINWDRYLRGIGAPNFSSLIVMQPRFIKAVSALVATSALDDWKTYLEWHLINDLSAFLSDPFIEQRFAFYGKVLAGDKKMKPLWRRVAKTVESCVGEALGKLYVKKYFRKDAKRKMEVLIDDLFDAFEDRIRSSDWMTAPTKRKAIQKLRAMNRKIGYPDKWKSYRGLMIIPGEYIKNVFSTAEFEHRRTMRKLGKPIDTHEWFMFPQTVNAYFAPTRNEIVFPAGILQFPFFDKRVDDALNYGGIGAVIGHEMSHAFDDEGSKFDGKGNLKNWWSTHDRKNFERRAKVVEKQFDAFTVAPGINVNGKLTLGENIADLGGVAIAYDAFKKHLVKNPSVVLDGLSPKQRFFIGYALSWREHFRLKYIKEMVRTNPHSPDMFRTNGPLSNFDGFYETFKVKPGDTLYRSPKDRAKIW